jgi:hypothetical protein
MEGQFNFSSVNYAQRTRGKTAAGNITLAVVYLIFYWIFSTFTSSSYYYESPLCVDLLRHSQTVSTLYYYMALLFIAFLIIQCIYDTDLVQSAKGIIQLTAIIMFFIYCVLITIDLTKGEPCGDLYTLDLVWVILNWVGCGCICCVVCFMACFGAGLGAVMAYGNRI